MNVTEVSRIARSAARKASPQLDVLGVTMNAGGSDYVEILVEIRGCQQESCQVVVGVFRNVTESALEDAITAQLRQHLSTAHADSSSPE